LKAGILTSRRRERLERVLETSLQVIILSPWESKPAKNPFNSADYDPPLFPSSFITNVPPNSHSRSLGRRLWKIGQRKSERPAIIHGRKAESEGRCYEGHKDGADSQESASCQGETISYPTTCIVLNYISCVRIEMSSLNPTGRYSA
jgi:hypothetical protein